MLLGAWMQRFHHSTDDKNILIRTLSSINCSQLFIVIICWGLQCFNKIFSRNGCIWRYMNLLKTCCITKMDIVAKLSCYKWLEMCILKENSIWLCMVFDLYSFYTENVKQQKQIRLSWHCKYFYSSFRCSSKGA